MIKKIFKYLRDYFYKNFTFTGVFFIGEILLNFYLSIYMYFNYLSDMINIGEYFFSTFIAYMIYYNMIIIIKSCCLAIYYTYDLT